MLVEDKFEKLSYEEAPKIIVKPPGEKSKLLLNLQKQLETESVVYPKIFQMAIDSAKGATIRDVDGNYYIDWIAGIAVMNVGHSNPYIIESIKNQLDKYVHWMSEIPSEIRVEFLKKLHSILPMRSKVMTTVTGADACEAAIALAKWITGKQNIIAFDGAYHGVHQGIISATAKRELQHYSGMPYIGVVRAPYPYPYRCPFRARDEEECGELVLEYLERLLSDPYSGVGEIAGILVEPIQGEGGYIVPPKNFLKGLRELADKYSLLLIIDEVQSGVGRTGKWWALEHFGVTPDIMCISKAIGGGIPISFIAFKEEFDNKLPEMFHLGTYRANPLGLAAGKAVIEYIQNNDLLERTSKLGEYALSRFLEMKEKYEIIGDVRGKGFMIGIEIVDDKNTKKPSQKLANMIRRELFQRGILMHTCGHYGNVMRFMAPLIISRRHLDIGLDIFENVIREVTEKK